MNVVTVTTPIPCAICGRPLRDYREDLPTRDGDAHLRCVMARRLIEERGGTWGNTSRSAS